MPEFRLPGVVIERQNALPGAVEVFFALLLSVECQEEKFSEKLTAH